MASAPISQGGHCTGAARTSLVQEGTKPAPFCPALASDGVLKLVTEIPHKADKGGLSNHITKAGCTYAQTHFCTWVKRTPNGKHRKQGERQENSGFLCLGTQTGLWKCSLKKCRMHSGLGSFANIIFKYIWLWINGIHRALI